MNYSSKKYLAMVGMFAIRTGIIYSGEQIDCINKVSNLARAHHRQCENACNGEGFVPYKGSFSTAIPYSATPQRGMESAYIEICPDCGSTDLYWPKEGTPNDDVFECGACGKLKPKDELEDSTTIFDIEISRLQKKIVEALRGTPISAQFQQDARGATVKIKYNYADQKKGSVDLTELLYL